MSVAIVPSRLHLLLSFLQKGRAGGVILIFSSVLAVIWANSPFAPTYFTLLAFHVGTVSIPFFVNDGLMALFFLAVGLELRREINDGELRTPDRLATPIIAALGGMLVPAVVFSVFNYRDLTAMRGWAVPIATDIAFALAVVGVLGGRVPIALTVFLTALAIIDDLGAIIVIALFYSDQLHVQFIAGALAIIAALWWLNRLGVASPLVYGFAGFALWFFVHRSGLHATLSGVALAFVLPARSKGSKKSGLTVRLGHFLNPLVAYLILPLFGLTNAGLRLGALPDGVFTEPLFLGTALALIIGKPAGIFSAVMLACRFRMAALPIAVSKTQLFGAAIICGIGFTMSLFVGDLAFGDSTRHDEIKVAVFFASITSALLGLLVIATGSRHKPLPKAQSPVSVATLR